MTQHRASDAGAAYTVRRARPDDVGELVRMCAEHAQYERAAYAAAGKEQALLRALSAAPPLLHAWIATAGDAVVGYATAVAEFSTWACTHYLHMDCLYVREHARNRGVGDALLDAVADFARASGYREVQWQTPEWNGDACRFYHRKGAVGAGKIRFMTRPLMLQMRPNCECCDKDLPPDATDAWICSFECTYCTSCHDSVLHGVCPNCGGDLTPRPTRQAHLLAKYPASSERVLKAGGCAPR